MKYIECFMCGALLSLGLDVDGRSGVRAFTESGKAFCDECWDWSRSTVGCRSRVLSTPLTLADKAYLIVRKLRGLKDGDGDNG